MDKYMTYTDEQLIDKAIAAAQNAYAPYSNFKVGAVVVLDDDTIIPGANVENAGYSLTNCAERSALFAVYSQGYKKENIKKIAVVTDTDTFGSPCGACRQVMSELLELDCPIILSNFKKSDIKITNIKELLPFMFTL